MNAINRFIKANGEAFRTPFPATFERKVGGTANKRVKPLAINNYCDKHGFYYPQLVGEVCPDCLRPAKKHTYSDWLMNPKTGTRTRVVDGSYIEREGDDIIRFEDDPQFEDESYDTRI